MRVLAQLVHPAAGPDTLFVVLKVYLDESGINRDAFVCVVAGYAANTARWKKFEKDWASILKRYRVAEFHAKDFFRRDEDGNPLHEHYRHLGRDGANAFLNDLINAINKAKPKMIGKAVLVEDFFSFSLGERRYLTGAQYDPTAKKFLSSGAPETHFHVPMQAVVINAALGAKRLKEKAHFVCDRQDEYAPLVVERFAEIAKRNPDLPLGDLVHSDSRDVCALQAADLACWGASVYAKKRFKKNETETDYMVRRLLEREADFELMDARKLRLLLEGFHGQ
ncbi:MAG TPA: DUF3800 domain-containing protein [Terriglobales bacterium]|nr:DUF3800 domain-containing protein [Terriglobales bacterium]